MPKLPMHLRTRLARWLACLLLGAATSLNIQAQPEPTYEWDIELLSMDLNASGVLMPLGPGWSPILTDIHVGESATLASAGKAFAFPARDAGLGRPGAAPAAPAAPAPGEEFFVQSFFDVFFDITVTDIDPVANFGGGPTDGLSMSFPDNGPAHMENFYLAVADPAAPNFGLIPPPEAAPYIGHFTIEIPLGVDLNGNGEEDKIKFTLVAHTVGDENRTYIILPDGTVLDQFDSTADLSGAVVDLSEDPPFGPISLTGPTTAWSRLVGGGGPTVPDAGSTLLLLSGSLLGLLGGCRRWLRA